jgi:hypothetical protein
MKNVIVGVVAALALSWANPAAAQAITGNKLLEIAAGAKRVEAGTPRTTDWQDDAYLSGFVTGVADTLNIIDPLVCLPKDSNSGQWQRVLLQYLEANPAELHRGGTTLAIAAFRKAFPCR